MDGDIPKPIKPKELIEAIDGLLPCPPSPHHETGNPAGKQLIDEAALLARFEGDQELIKEVARLFADDSSRLLDEIRGALDSMDAQKLEIAAHALKGSIGNFAAKDAFDAALQLEIMGRTGNLAGAQKMLPGVESQVAELKAALNRLIERLSTQ